MIKQYSLGDLFYRYQGKVLISIGYITKKYNNNFYAIQWLSCDNETTNHIQTYLDYQLDSMIICDEYDLKYCRYIPVKQCKNKYENKTISFNK